MTFDPEIAARARMTRDELKRAVDERIAEDGIILPLDTDTRRELLAKIVLSIMYERYEEERLLAAEVS